MKKLATESSEASYIKWMKNILSNINDLSLQDSVDPISDTNRLWQGIADTQEVADTQEAREVGTITWGGQSCQVRENPNKNKASKGGKWGTWRFSNTTGGCPKGDECKFAHSKQAKKRKRCNPVSRRSPWPWRVPPHKYYHKSGRSGNQRKGNKAAVVETREEVLKCGFMAKDAEKEDGEISDDTTTQGKREVVKRPKCEKDQEKLTIIVLRSTKEKIHQANASYQVKTCGTRRLVHLGTRKSQRQAKLSPKCQCWGKSLLDHANHVS